jgi:hypothetical protein
MMMLARSFHRSDLDHARLRPMVPTVFGAVQRPNNSIFSDSLASPSRQPAIAGSTLFDNTVLPNLSNDRCPRDFTWSHRSWRKSIAALTSTPSVLTVANRTVTMQCTKCKYGVPLVRAKRKGFLERNVYRRFGYYPWMCPYCKKQTLLKERGERRISKRGDPSRGLRIVDKLRDSQ